MSWKGGENYLIKKEKKWKSRLEKTVKEVILVEDLHDYLVKIDRFKKYRSILKNSIENTEFGSDRKFLMQDMLSVEQAL